MIPGAIFVFDVIFAMPVVLVECASLYFFVSEFFIRLAWSGFGAGWLCLPYLGLDWILPWIPLVIW